MMIDEPYQRFPLLGGQLQAGRNALGEQRAGFGVWAAHGLAAVVEEKCEIQNQWVRELFKQFAIMNQLRIIGLRQCIKFVDAHQRVLVGSIPVQKLVLHKAGELAEFGNVPAKKVHPMHHPQDASNSAFLGQNRRKDRTRSARILIRSGYVAQASAQQVFQFRAEIEVTLLGQRKCAHHLLGVVTKNIAPCRMDLFVSNKEGITNRSLVPSCEGKKTEKSAGFARNVSAHELLRDSLRHTQDISRVVVAVPHKRLTSKLASSRRISEPLCDLVLQIHVQYVGGAPGRVMQVCAQAQKKIVRVLDSALVAFAQPVFPYELVRAQRTFFEVGNPKQILIVAQSATAALQVGLLQINAVAEFFVPGDLVLHA